MASFLNPHIYDAIAKTRASWPRIPVYSEETYSQCAEDLIVCALLRRLAVREALDLSKERYLEIGGNHPFSCSATWLLHRRFGMIGVIAEANPHLTGELRRLRPADRTLDVAITPEAGVDFVEIHIGSDNELSSLDRSFVEKWPGWEVNVVESVRTRAMTINSLLDKEFPEGAPLFMSIDIEGLDLAVLQSMDWTIWRPAIVTAEPSEHHLPGNAAALAQLFSDSGYIVIGATNVNLIAIDATRLGIDVSEALDQARREMADLARERDIARSEAADFARERDIARSEAADFARERDIARSEAADLARERDIARSEAADLARERDIARSEAADFARERDIARSEMARMNRMIQSYGTRQQDTLARLETSEFNNAAAKRELMTLEAECNRLQSEIVALKLSSSWRLTEPMRFIGRLMGRRRS